MHTYIYIHMHAHTHIYILRWVLCFFLCVPEASRYYFSLISSPVVSELAWPLRWCAWPPGRPFCCSTRLLPLCREHWCESASPKLRAGSRSAGRWGARRLGMSWTWFDRVVSETSGVPSSHGKDRTPEGTVFYRCASCSTSGPAGQGRCRLCRLL